VISPLSRLDRAALRLFRTRLRSEPLDRAALAYTKAGEWGALWIGLSLPGALLDRQRRARWLATGAVVPFALTTNYVVKVTVRRRRPVLPGLPVLGRVPTSRSFPSAHAATSFAGAEAISALEPSARVPLRAAAALMALTRPYLGVHYLSDVIAGAFLGTAVGRLAGSIIASGTTR
jgi:decaprenylphosphoryl-5-phosphoribose phosphatase